MGRRLASTVRTQLEVNLSAPLERIWAAGRLIVALGVLAGTALLLRAEPILPIYVGLMLFVLAYGSALFLLLEPSRTLAVFLVGFALDNAVILSAWWTFLAMHREAVQTNDMYLAIVPFIMLGIARLGWLAGGLYAAFWITWLAITSVYFYGSDSYDIQQLPVRVIFIGAVAIMAMRFVALIARER
ncbi:MAG: hypothetical protein HY682_07395 [Chloroflexi bacterium]|nr:hypothetical protein [Chloroflexota bacterium]